MHIIEMLMVGCIIGLKSQGSSSFKAVWCRDYRKSSLPNGAEHFIHLCFQQKEVKKLLSVPRLSFFPCRYSNTWTQWIIYVDCPVYQNTPWMNLFTVNILHGNCSSRSGIQLVKRGSAVLRMRITGTLMVLVVL